jgi:SRSO17 transposase
VSRPLVSGDDLDSWLSPFIDAMGRSTRRRWGPLYVRGLLGPDGPKSVQPLAASLGLPGHDQLHHFISSAAWDDAPLWSVLAREADKRVGGPASFLVVDDTGIPKKGTHSVGVAAQYCGELGKQANCQVLVSLTLARDEIPIPIGLRLFLPKGWTDDENRCAAAGVPEDARTTRTKPEIALAEIDRVIAADVRFGCVLADAGYGISAAFRQGMSARGLSWAVGVPRTVKVYSTKAEAIWPVASRGPKRKQPVASEDGENAASVLAKRSWRRVTWRNGTKGPLSARFASVRVRVADGPPVREGKHLPGDEVWLIGEWRDNGERKYHFSNLPRGTSLRKLAASLKARWVCEQAHQQLKQELGLGDFEGRSWTGLHRHALMSCIAFAFLQHIRLKTAKRRGKKSS